MKNTKTCPLTGCAEYFNRQQVQLRKKERKKERRKETTEIVDFSIKLHLVCVCVQHECLT